MKLSHRTLFFVLLPIVIFAISLTSVNHIVHSEHMQNITVEKVTLLSQVASYEMVNPMYNLDVDRLNEIIDGLQEQSRRPYNSPNAKVNDTEEALILSLRKERNLGARRIQNELNRENGLSLSLATIHKVLTKK